MRRARLAFVVLIALLVAGVVWLAFRPTNSAPSLAQDPATLAREVGTHPVALDAPTSPPRTAATEPERAANADAQTKSDAEHAPPQQLLLYGFVRPAEGRNVLDKNTNVALIDRLGHTERAEVGTDGAYSFSSVHLGHYWLRAGSHDGGEVRAQTDLDGSVTEKRLDLQLVLPRQILIKVVDADGNKFWLPGMLAVATREPPGDWFDDVVGSFNNPFGVGHFWGNEGMSEKLDDAYFGRVILDVEPPVYLSVLHFQRVVATQRVEPGVSEVTFKLDRNSPLVQCGSLRFRFVDAETRTVVASKGVMLCGAMTSLPRPDGDVFHCEKLQPGWYEIRATVAKYEQLRDRVRVEPGVENDLGDLELNRELWVSGSMTDDEGHAATLELSCEPYDSALGAARRSGNTMGYRPNADGSFRVGGLSRGTYLLEARTQGTSWATWSRVIDTTSGPVENVRIQLVRGVPLVVRASDPDAWSTVRFAIIDSTGQRVRSTRLWAPEPQPILLAPGNYSVEVRGSGSSDPKRIAITIASQPVELALP